MSPLIKKAVYDRGVAKYFHGRTRLLNAFQSALGTASLNLFRTQLMGQKSLTTS